MSLHDYEFSKALTDAPFFALLMAAMRGADTRNAAALRAAFPHVWEELDVRYNSPRGLLRGESDGDGWTLDREGNLRDPDGEIVRAV